MESVKKSIDERALHKREYDIWMNERQMQITEDKVDSREVDQNAEQCHDTCPLPSNVNDNQTTELTNQSLESENIRLKKTVAQFQKVFLRMEAHCVNLELTIQIKLLKKATWWKPTGKIFKTVGLRWVPTGKIITSSTTTVDSEPPNGSNEDITNPYECKQTLDVSAGTLNMHAGTSLNPTKEGL
ncbi:hypothetical protein Tco_1058682 [Tanacetum coccineum]|uniref:Uncharacterized protein n=1 Tax=Tanacetum coccineum TaxID=301880 RepID=A0ABQ5H9K8_9ASTR